ncbi:ribokinase [Streptomyces roseirectus]|uniref:Ribokinase n=1 Tax=Streptomyces roseirectus TaxID=2768066 RepID=A0A7H0IKF2_9ACTN|nr:ribokinase [Streptomyces roseirectus]QNP73268.1 ribokinase [Streptomyces roseirectus]
MTHIVVLGSTNMDLVTHAPRPPAPGETLTGRDFRTTPGGKGANQAIAAARAGATVSMIGAVGTDPQGPLLRATLDQAGVNTDHLRTMDTASGTAHITVDDDGGSAIVVIPGANGTVDHLAPGDETLIASADTLLLLQLEIPLPAVVAAARAARAHGVRTVLTPSPVTPLPPELLAVTDLLVPNAYEAITLSDRTDPVDAARHLLTLVPEVIVTLGAAGALHVSRTTAPLAVPAPHTTPVDSTAARDTFVGALATALGEERPLDQALRWAAAAASLSVERPGAATSMPYRQEIEERHAA